MIGMLASLALGVGIPKSLSRVTAWAVVVVSAGLAIWGVYALVHGNGEKAGAAKVTAKVEKAHTERVAESRADERQAQTVTNRIADRTVRADAATDAYVRQTIEDLRNALATEPAAPADAVPSPAPVGSMSASLNALVDRANRAAETADAAK